jgi:hypothetical protein
LMEEPPPRFWQGQCGGMIPQHMNSGEAPQLERNLRSTESAA